MNNQRFCANCGNALSENEKFCGKCGTPAPVAEENLQPAGQVQNAVPQQGGMPFTQNEQIPNGAAYSQPAQQGMPQNAAFAGAAAAPAKPNPLTKVIDLCKQNKKIPIIAGAALVVIIVGIIILANILKYQVIDAKDLFKIEFDGINTCGTVSGNLNAYDSYMYTGSSASDILSDYGVDVDIDNVIDSATTGSEKVSPYFSLKESDLLDAYTKAGDKKEATKMRSALLKTNSKGNYKLKVKFDKETGLSNGDKVKCTVSYDEDYLKENNIKLKNTEFEVEVKDLEDGTKLNPFDCIDVTFSGVNGSGTANVSNKDDVSYAISYDYDYTSSLSNGDKFTVTADCYSAEKSGDKYWFKYNDKYYVVENQTMTKDYEVSGLTELKEIDPFDNIEFNFSEGTPYLSVNGVNTDNAEEMIKSYVSYSIDDADDLKVGDKFTVKAYGYSYLEDEGYKLAGTPDSDGYVTKEFTVDDTFPSYVNADNLADANKSFDEKFADSVTGARQELQGSSYVSNIDVDGKIKSITSYDVAETYVANNQANSVDSISWGKARNGIMRVYKVVVATEDGEKTSQTFYGVLTLPNVISYNGEFTTDNDISITYYPTLKEATAAVTGAEGYTVATASAGQTATTKPATDSTADTTTTTTAATTTKAGETTSAAGKETTTTTTKSGAQTTTSESTLVP